MVLNQVPCYWVAGDNWDNQNGCSEYMFEPLKPGETVTLENE